jgi:hypothetical protein
MNHWSTRRNEGRGKAGPIRAKGVKDDLSTTVIVDPPQRDRGEMTKLQRPKVRRETTQLGVLSSLAA